MTELFDWRYFTRKRTVYKWYGSYIPLL